jgi:mono/diheme cytochrome c family protein
MFDVDAARLGSESLAGWRAMRLLRLGVSAVLALLVAMTAKPLLKPRAKAEAVDAGMGPLAPNVDWGEVAAAASLVGEEYGEALETPGQLDLRRPAMLRRLDSALGMARSAQPRALRVEAMLLSLEEKVKGPVIYVLPSSFWALSAQLEGHGKYEVTPRAKPSLEHGRQVYSATCASCHGEKADGVSPLAASLNPHPPDLLHEEHNWRPADMFARITYGGLETPMPAFGHSLSASDRWDVVFYLFAERWGPCERAVTPMSSSALAVSSDFDLSNRVEYAAISCLRRSFLGP